RQIRWLDIEDFFPTGNYDLGYNEYVINCKNGEQFFLSKDLTESDKLFELVGKKLLHIGIDHSGMDVRLEFEGGYIVEMFTHAQTDPWKICHKEDILLCANKGS
ncbi:MAG: hypothetical protein K2X69_13545, partial [Silvanigrellaceae bacterium]|nr:hypothetical protein [Silvanigrellaceae bacterium]